MPSLVEELQRKALDSNTRVVDLLRMAKMTPLFAHEAAAEGALLQLIFGGADNRSKFTELSIGPSQHMKSKALRAFGSAPRQSSQDMNQFRKVIRITHEFRLNYRKTIAEEI